MNRLRFIIKVVILLIVKAKIPKIACLAANRVTGQVLMDLG